MMQQTYDKLENVIKAEYREANRNYAMFSSPHEGYGVVKEEVEEMAAELDTLYELFANFWDCVKRDDDEGANEFIMGVENRAHLMASEAVQVSAMCRKYKDSSKKWFVGKKKGK